jgi:hypothetical protein
MSHTGDIMGALFKVFSKNCKHLKSGVYCLDQKSESKYQEFNSCQLGSGDRFDKNCPLRHEILKAITDNKQLVKCGITKCDNWINGPGECANKEIRVTDVGRCQYLTREQFQKLLKHEEDQMVINLKHFVETSSERLTELYKDIIKHDWP